jgi:GTPase SAR1 family protein
MADDSEMMTAIVEAVTARVVQQEHVSGRRASQSVSVGGGRISVDDTLDMIKLVVVGDSGVGKTCIMLRFVKDEFVTARPSPLRLGTAAHLRRAAAVSAEP